MKFLPHALLLALSPPLGGCMTTADVPVQPVGEATLAFADGRPAGKAVLFSDPQGLRISVQASGLEPGPHGFHLHTTGKCEGPAFTSAGGHLNPGNRKHGSLADGGSHLGDLPNLTIGTNGTGSATEMIGGGSSALAAIFDGDGTAVVVHADADDYRTDPSGNAGNRVACGVLKRAA